MIFSFENVKLHSLPNLSATYDLQFAYKNLSMSLNSTKIIYNLVRLSLLVHIKDQVFKNITQIFEFRNIKMANASDTDTPPDYLVKLPNNL